MSAVLGEKKSSVDQKKKRQNGLGSNSGHASVVAASEHKKKVEGKGAATSTKKKHNKIPQNGLSKTNENGRGEGKGGAGSMRDGDKVERKKVASGAERGEVFANKKKDQTSIAEGKKGESTAGRSQQFWPPYIKVHSHYLFFLGKRNFFNIIF
tara:strand:- start:306 stop:764 length:459 start_codon:yes stop_codon:yes gene_type:complete